MARPLGYTPPTLPDTGPRDDVDDLVRALHESGLLRAVTGAVAAYPQLLGRVLRQVDADTVRSGIALAGALRGLDPEGSERVADGVRRARAAARDAAAGRPEGVRALLKRLRDPDTRRGLSAALAAAAALGGALGEHDAEDGREGDGGQPLKA